MRASLPAREAGRGGMVGFCEPLAYPAEPGTAGRALLLAWDLWLSACKFDVGNTRGAEGRGRQADS